MNKMTRNNLWAAAIAWILFLNGYGILSIICLAIMDYALLNRSDIRFIRLLSCFLICLASLAIALHFSSISYYFPAISYFLIAISMHIAFLYEYLDKEKEEGLFKASIMAMAVGAFFFIIAIFLPDSWYDIFTKTNLYLLVGIVFMPYALSMAIKCFIVECKQQKAIASI